MSLADRARAAWASYRNDLSLPADWVELEAPKLHDFRKQNGLVLSPSDGGQKMYIQVHSMYSPHVNIGDFVILPAVKPQGSRYRLVEHDWGFHVDWAWAARLEFAPRTQEEVDRDEQDLQRRS